MEFAPNFVPEDFSKYRTKSAWEDYVASGNNIVTRSVLRKNGLLGSPLPPFDVPIHKDSLEYKIFERIYNLERKSTPFNNIDDVPDSYFVPKTLALVDLAKQVKADDFRSLVKLVERLNEILGIPTHTSLILMLGLCSIYLMSCRPDNFLVGIKDKPQWKNVKIAKEKEGDDHIPPLFYTAMSYLEFLPIIGQRENAVVPQMILPIADLFALKYPEVTRDVSDYLEEAYFNQRYTLRSDGPSEIRFRNAQDIRAMMLLQSGQNLFARLITNYGDAMIHINLKTAEYRAPANWFKNPGLLNPFASLVAETYRDLVTAKEVYYHRARPLRSIQTTTLEFANAVSPMDDQLQVIYIPRTYQKVQYTEPRVPYTGEPRPVRPHPVVGHKRKGNMTIEHLKELRELEAKWDIPFVDRIPAGYTFVKPHFSPTGSEEYISKLPIYIKMRIQQEIERGLKPNFNIDEI